MEPAAFGSNKSGHATDCMSIDELPRRRTARRYGSLLWQWARRGERAVVGPPTQLSRRAARHSARRPTLRFHVVTGSFFSERTEIKKLPAKLINSDHEEAAAGNAERATPGARFDRNKNKNEPVEARSKDRGSLRWHGQASADFSPALQVASPSRFVCSSQRDALRESVDTSQDRGRCRPHGEGLRSAAGQTAATMI
ncbi:unnamed protein product [Lampetra planeri]